MKKLLSVALAAMMMFSLAACGKEEPKTVTEQLVAEFNEIVKENADSTVLDIAVKLSASDCVSAIGPVGMDIEEGFLMGFDNEEITGFKSGATFAPMIGTIPFIGYVFELEEGADVDAFVQMLKDGANLRWNICSAAEEMACEAVGNKVVFVMAPLTFEQE